MGVLSSDPSSDLSDSRAPGISQATTAVPSTQAAGNKMQVLVASNSNKPSRQSSYSRASTEGNLTPGGGVANNKDIHSGITSEGPEGSNNLQNQTKFKSLGDLHMEKGLPSAPRYAASTAVSSAHRRLSKLFKLSSSSSNTTSLSKKRTSSYYVTD